MAGTGDLTDLYRVRLGAANTGLLARLASLWLAGFDPADPVASISTIAAAAASMVTGTQAVTAAEAAGYLRALTAHAAGTGLDQAAPYAVPADLVGSTAAGMPMGDLTGIAAHQYAAARQAGADQAQAARSASSWLYRVAASEPYRAANAVTTANASGDDRLTGRVFRVTRRGACDFCLTIAQRGYIPSHAGFKAHAHCYCVASAEISKRVYSRSSLQRARAAEAEAAQQQAADELAARESLAATVPRQRPQPAYEMHGFDDAPEERAAISYGIDRALAKIRPDVAAKLRTVHREPPPKGNPNWWANYQWGAGRLAVQPGMTGWADETRRAVKSGWWTPNGGKTPAATITAHEVGHFLEDQLTASQVAEVRAAVADAARIKHVSEVEGAVSKYGSQSAHEMIAECWQEYVNSPHPRPAAKAAGDVIVKYLGAHP